MKKIIYILAIVSMLITPLSVKAASAGDILQQINDLQGQIDSNQALLSQKNKETKNLNNQIAIFDGQIRDAQLQISKTQAEVNKNQSEIDDLQDQITKKEAELKKQKEDLFETVRVMYESGDDQGMVQVIAGSDSLSDIIDKSQYLASIQEKIDNTVTEIKNIKKDLENKKAEQEKKKLELTSLLDQQQTYKNNLNSQKAAKDQLLAQTKGQEAAYQQKVNAAQVSQAEAWADYEQALAASNASGGSEYRGGSGNGYLSWPSSGYVTQGYGCTTFAMCGNPRGPYGGNIHNGLDLSMGWAGPIKAAADGTVLDMGQEYNSHGWGNWIIVRHPNGLATLYAHLSRFSVSVGQSVSKGQVIGLEGNTGYSTGSHLHFSVFTNLVLYNGSYHGPAYSGTVNPYSFL